MLGLDVQHNIISYAVVSAKYEDDKSLFNSFMPLVEHLLLSFHSDYIAIDSIIESYTEMYGYSIHAAILDEFITLFEKQGKIVRLKGNFIQINREKMHTYGKNEEYETSLRALLGDFHFFLKKRGKDINRADIPNHMLSFIRKNALEFNSFLQYESNLEDTTESNEITPDLIEFFLEERRNDTRNYKFICSIYYGVVLSSMMIAGENSQDVISDEFTIENVLLDSNYIFRLLDLQTPLEHQAAMDTFNTLKQMNCLRWVCRETLQQVANTIHKAISQHSNSVSAVLRIIGDEKFSGLASACIRKELSPAKLEEIVDNLESTLKNEFGIELIDPEEFNIESFKKTDDDYCSLASIKRDTSDAGIIHDLFIIDVVKTKRPQAIYKPVQANWWLLTDDNKLTRWRSKHLSSSKVNECITESQLATIMWVCNPETVSHEGFFNAVIAMRNQGLVGRTEFEKISKNIEHQRKKYAEDPKALKKLALVFSQKMMQLDVLSSDDEVSLDAIFEQKMKEADEILRQKDIATEEKDNALCKEQEKNKRLTGEVQTAKALLSAETEALITTWKNVRDDKRNEAKKEEGKAIAAEAKFAKQIRIGRIILSLLIAAIVLGHLPLIDEIVGEFYNEHQLVCNAGWSVIAFVVFILFGVDRLKIGNSLNTVSKRIVTSLAKIKIIRNYNAEAAECRTNAEKLSGEAKRLQDKIDEKLNGAISD